MKKLILVIVPLFVMGIFLILFLLFRFGKPCECYGAEINNKCIGIRTMCFGLGPAIPLKDFDQEKSVLEINFNGTLLKIDDVFNFSPSDGCVGDIKARVVSIYDNGISLDVLEEQGLNRNYYEVKPSKNITIKDGVCVLANPLCMDASYEYCFSVDKTVKPNVYSYEIKGESTMPLPNEK